MMRIVLVGESWGSHEEVFQHPLVWWSGIELAKMLYESKLAPKLRVTYPKEHHMIEHWKWLREDHGIAVTNVFQEHPIGDKTELFFDNIGEADLDPLRIKSRVLRLRPQYRHHVERLFTELEAWKPNVIVALGNFACWALLGQSGITAIRGTPKLCKRLNIKTIPTFHPAALRDMKLKPTIVADLNKANRESEYPEIRRTKRNIICEDPRTHERVTIAEIEDSFKIPATHYSIDIETGYALYTRAELKSMTAQMRHILSELISMISFARDPYNSVVIPLMTRDDKNLSYWTPEDEAKILKILIYQLRSPISKSFQNGIFDISVFLMNNMLVFSATDDTMILSHALYPELPKSLGYMGSIHASELSWKQIREKGETLKREE